MWGHHQVLAQGTKVELPCLPSMWPVPATPWSGLGHNQLPAELSRLVFVALISLRGLTDGAS